jgi:transposase
MTTNKTYSPDVRESAAKLVLEADQPIAETARELGVNENTFHTWIKKYSRPKKDGRGHTDEHLYEELKRLKKDNSRLREERDLLKKAAAYFAKCAYCWCSTSLVKYAWIDRYKNDYPIARLYRFMQVSTSSYSAWLKRPLSPREQDNQQLIIRLKVLFEQGQAHMALVV